MNIMPVSRIHTKPRTNLSTNKDSDAYTKKFNYNLTIFNHTFYDLDYIDYIVWFDTEPTSSINWSQNMKELYDLVRINTIREQELTLDDIAKDDTEDSIEFDSFAVVNRHTALG